MWKNKEKVVLNNDFILENKLKLKKEERPAEILLELVYTVILDKVGKTMIV